MTSEVATRGPGEGRRPAAPISWASIIAGAVVSVAVSILLTLLAAGFGATLTPAGLATRGSLSAFTPVLGAGAVLVQVVSGGLGGYVAGRLRHQWPGADPDEAHFRDTAHGLVAWALSAIVGLILAAAVFAPFAEQLTVQVVGQAAGAGTMPVTPQEAQKAANIAAQAAFFTAVGMLLSAFTAAVAARLGGLENEDMHARLRSPNQT